MLSQRKLQVFRVITSCRLGSVYRRFGHSERVGLKGEGNAILQTSANIYQSTWHDVSEDLYRNKHNVPKLYGGYEKENEESLFQNV
jgi:hypothetical protein